MQKRKVCKAQKLNSTSYECYVIAIASLTKAIETTLNNQAKLSLSVSEKEKF